MCTRGADLTAAGGRSSSSLGVHANMHANVKRKTPTNIPRRAIGVALCFAPLAALLASLAVGITHPQTSRFAGVGFMIAAAVIALLNAILRGSGVPILGTILLSIGVLDGFGATGSAVIGLATFVLDTGGSGWFVLSTWRDRGFWDGDSSKSAPDT